jgi:hypothetical protein
MKDQQGSISAGYFLNKYKSIYTTTYHNVQMLLTRYVAKNLIKYI